MIRNFINQMIGRLPGKKTGHTLTRAPGRKLFQMDNIYKLSPGHKPIEPIRVIRERGGDGWLVLRRAHGWLHGDLRAAIVDARTMGTPVLDGGRAA